jgi:protein-disulfide isomerase
LPQRRCPLGLWLPLTLALLLVGCGAKPTPEATQATGGPTSTRQIAYVRTSTPAPPAATATRAPTATWVPLPSPHPTAVDSQPSRADVPLVGLGDAWTLAAEGKASFVDVRPPANYEQERIPGAISMPVGEVAQRYHQLPADRLLIFYCNCKAEAKSIEAALAAIANGLTQVAVLDGGWQAWLRAGYLVEGTNVASVSYTAANRVLGSPDAPITMVEFSDFQCPYCARYALETLPQIEEQYVETGLVYYIFKDLPLPIHSLAQKAAEASRCAGVQDSFWEMHRLLFESQEQWSALDQAGALVTFATYARELDLDVPDFEACLTSGEFADQVLGEQEEAERAGVQVVPAFLINGRRMAGAYPFAEFERLIEAELAQEE